MRFTVLSHACMLVETGDVKLIVDPWLVGSCYWRSWWNYPPPPDLTGILDDVDYIYLTHHHWDHFHGPSLRKLPKSATILIPKAHSTRLRDDLQGFRFNKIVEMPHATSMDLKGGLRLSSYHFGLALDSTLAIEAEGYTLLDMNDCKLSGLGLRQARARHPKIDFLFRSHSNASVYPFCVDADDPKELEYRTNKDYLDDFVRTAEFLRPRHAIPFASNHCFLHKETFRYNETVVSPLEVKRSFDERAPAGSDCVVMTAGDSWDSATGFQLHEQDFFTNRDERLAEYAERVKPKLEKHYVLEDRMPAKFEWFRGYFEDMVRSLPAVSRLMMKAVVIFRPSSLPSAFWVVDFGRRRVYEAEALPPDWKVEITIHPAVLRDCLRRRMFRVLMPSKRLSVRVAAGAMRDFFLFTNFLDMYEYDYFPMRKMMTWRFLSAWLRRWREIGYYMSIGSKMVLARGGPEGIRAAVPKVE